MEFAFTIQGYDPGIDEAWISAPLDKRDPEIPRRRSHMAVVAVLGDRELLTKNRSGSARKERPDQATAEKLARLLQQVFTGMIAKTYLLVFVYGNNRITQGIKHLEQSVLLQTPSPGVDVQLRPVYRRNDIFSPNVG